MCVFYQKFKNITFLGEKLALYILKIQIQIFQETLHVITKKIGFLGFQTCWTKWRRKKSKIKWSGMCWIGRTLFTLRNNYGIFSLIYFVYSLTKIIPISRMSTKAKVVLALILLFSFIVLAVLCILLGIFVIGKPME